MNAAPAVTKPRTWACAGAGALLVFCLFFRLGTDQWNLDELAYARAGAAYVHGAFTLNAQHPLLAKLLFGVSESLLGPQPLAVRLVSALAAAAIGLGLGVVAARRWGLWAAALVVVLWAAVPHTPLPVSRLGLLEPVTTLLGGAALVCGWRWWRVRTLRWALAAGGFAGLATGTKLTGITVLFAMIVFVAAYDRRRESLTAAVVALGAAAMCFVLTYLPAGTHAPALFRSMLRFQFHHAQVGHPILLAGHIYQRAPWWAFGYYQVRADGWAATIAISALCVVALLLSRGVDRQLTVFLALATALPVAALSISPVQLPHYGYVSQPSWLLLAVCGVVQIWRRWLSRPLPRLHAAVVVAALAAALLPVAAVAVDGVRRETGKQPDGYADLAGVFRQDPLGPDMRVAVWGYAPLATAYLGRWAQGTACANTGCEDVAVVIDPSVATRFDDPSVRRLLRSDQQNYDCDGVDELTVCIRLRVGSSGA